MATTVILPAAVAQTSTISVDLELRTGGALSGLVVDHTPAAIVIVHDSTPFVFAWDEIESASAYATKRDLLIHAHRDPRSLTAEDHFQLGQFALSRRRTDLAAPEFRKAKQLDRSYAERITEAYTDYNRRKRKPAAGPDGSGDTAIGTAAETTALRGLAERMKTTFLEPVGGGTVAAVSPEVRARVLEIYKSFGETVREVISEDLALVETDHFLIWTDWEQRSRPDLAAWCEAMYLALCRQFELEPSDNIFLAKCPVFCWQSRNRFQRFARQFDGYDGGGAIGYTRSIAKNGHVHVVLVRGGRSQAAHNRFACTLVHEGTHAFLHRLHTTRLIPHWVNEGYADLVAERVLGNRCRNAEKAALLAKQYARYDWSISSLLRSVEPIEVHQYPLAHSVVAYLESIGEGRFAGFIRGLKNGHSVADALAGAYDGMTLDQLEARWRSAVRLQGADAEQ